MKNTALQQARIAKGLTQQDLAERLTVHRSTVIRWEQGIQPERFHQEKLCSLFGVSATQLGFSPSPNDTTNPGFVKTPLWYLPHLRNPFFTGRESILQQLHENLTHDRSALVSQSYALSGLGGIGKTQVAIEYAARYANDYTAVFWISAETNESIISSFIAIAELLNLPEKQEKEQSRVTAAVIRWLTNNNDWLVIFDNVENLELVKGVLPPARYGSLLFTSRRQALGFSALALDLEPMTLEEGMRFLLYRARLLTPTASLDALAPEDKNLARQITAAMDGLPLALDQAGAYIEATRCSLFDYLQLFHSSQLRLLDERDIYADHPSSVTNTFALAFEKLERSNYIAGNFLTVCAFLAPEAIPETFFTEGGTHLGLTFDLLANDLFAFQDTIKTLLTYSLIQRNAATKMITIHRLVQTILKERLPEDAKKGWEMRVLHAMARLFPQDSLNPVYLSRCEELLPHALVCLTFSQMKQEASFISLMNYVAAYLLERARFEEAEALFRDALDIAEHIMGKEHPLVAEALYGLAQFHHNQRQYEQAESLYQRTLTIFENNSGGETPQIAKVLNKLGILYLDQGKYIQAEPFYLQSVHIFENTLGLEHPQTANSWSGLGTFYTRVGQYEQAESLYQRTLTIFESALGFEHPRIASTLNNLAILSFFQGKYEQAEPLYEQALHNWETVLGSKHPLVAQSVNNLGLLYLEQGRYEKAASFYQRAVDIFKEVLGSEHVSIVMSLSGLADSLREQGKYDQSELYYNQCLRIVERASYSDDTPAIDPLIGLANLFKIQGKYDEAEPLYHHASIILQKNMGSQSWEFAYLLHYMAAFHHAQKHIEEAFTLYQQALTIFEQTLGLKHPRTKRVKNDIASLSKSEF